MLRLKPSKKPFWPLLRAVGFMISNITYDRSFLFHLTLLTSRKKPNFKIYYQFSRTRVPGWQKRREQVHLGFVRLRRLSRDGDGARSVEGLELWQEPRPRRKQVSQVGLRQLGSGFRAEVQVGRFCIEMGNQKKRKELLQQVIKVMRNINKHLNQTTIQIRGHNTSAKRIPREARRQATNETSRGWLILLGSGNESF